MNALIREFANDPGIRLAAGLILLSFVLGLSAAIKGGTFRMGWLSDFLRRDVLGKLVPYFAVWGAVRLGGDIEIAGFGAVEETVGALVIASVGATVLNSLRDLGLLPQTTPDAIAGPTEPPPPPPVP